MRARRIAGVIGIASAAAAVGLVGAGSPARATSVPAGRAVSIEVWLQPNTAAATRLANAVSTPGNAHFHHYLSPDAWTTRFAASQADVSRVETWLHRQGFSDVQVDPQRAYVRATTPTATTGQAVAAALATPPPALSHLIVGVTGLDEATSLDTVSQPAATAASVKCSHYYGQHTEGGLPTDFGTTTFPSWVCGYSAKQLRAAYGANRTNTGKGQTVALVEFGLGSQMFATLQDYAKVNGLPKPSTQRFHQVAFHGTRNCGALFDDGEEQMDVEAVYAMAPAANELVVGGDSCRQGDQGIQGLLDADQAVVDGNGRHPLASIVSNSWSGRFPQAAAVTKMEHSYLLKAAAEGVSMLFASGDGAGVALPQADPYATSVGGTVLGIGKTGNRLFETGWASDDLTAKNGAWHNTGVLGAAGGGSMPLYKQPAYQKGVVPAALSAYPGKGAGPFRTEPDISADADPATPMAVVMVNQNPGAKFVTVPGDGTSLAAPTVAGIVAAAQQGEKQPFGFLNPLIYQLAGTSAVHDVLPLTASSPARFRGALCRPAWCLGTALEAFDVQDRTAPYSGQVTLKGYDDMTGIGTPDGQYFIRALRAVANATGGPK